MRRVDRPIILAETGAVNDRHTGPFRFCRMDSRSIIFHDATFAGPAGTGQISHWDRYLDQKNLWRHYRPFADLVAGVQLDAEYFCPVDLSPGQVWFLGLGGKRHLLPWVRKSDSWHTVLRDETKPGPLEDQVFDLTSLEIGSGAVELCWPWAETAENGESVNGHHRLPSFRHGLMSKIRLP